MYEIKKIQDLEQTDQILLQAAKAACKNAYAPYSNFKVGAAALIGNGTIRVGSNLENVSYGLSICAEVALLAAVNSYGESNLVQKIAVSCLSDLNAKKGKFITPCGRCRQLFIELVSRIGRDIQILMTDLEYQSVLISTCHELLPHNFSEEVLGIPS